MQTQMTRSKPTGELLSLIDNSSRKKKYEKVSQKKNYWLGTKARSDEQHVAVKQHNIEKGVGANLLGFIDDDSTSTAGDFTYANMHGTMQGDI